ncbi:DUF4118 domain-containing protein [Terricaulis sp.]|uniref:DUF4118 domain-containing protein n=1 Tax=Terricaulis sp. TaxID=2768686 RepID=UPI0037843508
MPLTDHPRPSPDALLRLASKEGRGRLKLFLGAAPGVGKTYEMLLEAHTRKREHVDVVVGVVEHHGREETRSLIAGLEVVPRQQITYRGQVLKEMDLDAVLKRRPKLVLVDELAHTNVEGARHPKRWMDVQELLAAGIDVFSTMNVQHLESANDIVAKITSVQVRETVPDSILDLADEIEVVDITPEELQQRLRDGKVYPQEVAQRALANFFSAGNITALRELALRRAAERVDEALRAHMAEQGVEGPLAGERVLACIDPTPGALTVVRRAKRLADRLRAPWEAVHVATPESERAPKEARDALLDAFRLAEELGAETRSLNGDDPADEILAYARGQNVSHIVVGAASRPLWVEVFRGSIIRRLVRGAGDMAIEICPREEGKADAILGVLRLPTFGEPGGYVGASIFVAIATALAVLLDALTEVDLPNVSLVWVLAIIAAAIRYGMTVSIYAAVASALAYNFFLIPPLHTFTIGAPSNVYAVILFIAIGLAVSGVAARTRAQTMIARRQARRAADLESFARSLVAASGEGEIAASTAETASKLMFARVVVLSSRTGELESIAEAPGPELLGADDMAAAKWAFAQRRAAGWGSDTLAGARWLFVPVAGERNLVGVIGVRPHDDATRLDPDQRRILDLIAAQAGVALDRARFAQDASDARVEAESERLKGTLLSSVSHDLRTPLSTIRHAVESLIRYGDKHDAEARRTLLEAAAKETDRLSAFVQNLLDMTRIDAGVVKAKREPAEVAGLVEAAQERARQALEGKFVSHDVSTGLPLVLVDRALTESAIANVLENAGKYAPPDSTILVRAFRQDRAVVIEVLDEGPGFPAEALPRLFEKFVRGVEGDGRPPGTGLGLAIARGFLSAQGGSITAQNRSDHAGACVRIALPIEDA